MFSFCTSDKCLLPYYGGCHPTRLCANLGITVSCDTCLDGFYEADEADLFCTGEEFVLNGDYD